MITLIDLFEQWYCGRLILILGPCSECFLMLLLLRTMIQIHLLLSGRGYQVWNEGWPVESSICSNGWRAMETTAHQDQSTILEINKVPYHSLMINGEQWYFPCQSGNTRNTVSIMLSLGHQFLDVYWHHILLYTAFHFLISPLIAHLTFCTRVAFLDR